MIFSSFVCICVVELIRKAKQRKMKKRSGKRVVRRKKIPQKKLHCDVTKEPCVTISVTESTYYFLCFSKISFDSVMPIFVYIIRVYIISRRFISILQTGRIRGFFLFPQNTFNKMSVKFLKWQNSKCN